MSSAGDGFPKAITVPPGAVLCAFPHGRNHLPQWQRIGPADEKGLTVIWSSFVSRYELAVALICSEAAAASPGTVSGEALAEAYEVWGRGA